MEGRVGQYEILRKSGRGGMGVVYLARDARLDHDVAIKSLPEHLANDPVRLERFEREAKTLASMSHPNLAGIYGVEEKNGARYLVLEYVDGETFADRLDRGPLAAEDAIEFASQIAAGVEAAHEAGVAHRDLKLASVLQPSQPREYRARSQERSYEGQALVPSTSAVTASNHRPTRLPSSQ